MTRKQRAIERRTRMILALRLHPGLDSHQWWGRPRDYRKAVEVAPWAREVDAEWERCGSVLYGMARETLDRMEAAG